MPYHHDELLTVRPSIDPLGISSYKKAHNIYTLRHHGQHVAFVSTAPLSHSIGLAGELHITGPCETAATETKAMRRLASRLNLPSYEEWKLAKMRAAAEPS